MTAYYNEFDPKAAAWLRELISRGLIAPGEVDERSITDVRPDELLGFTQCHFFAGIGGWSYALRLAGWPDDRPVWTGSCPCQPYSSAGARGGADDPRNLWWAFRWHIDQCRPATVFGEQVASADGRDWLAGVSADLEKLGYQVGAADLCAASVGAPHIRQRLFWVGLTAGERPQGQQQAGAETRAVKRTCADGGMDNPAGIRCESIREQEHGEQQGAYRLLADGSGARGFWEEAKVVHGSDGKARRIKSGIEPLVDGAPARMVRLRGYGNAIVPQVAAHFIVASMTPTTPQPRREE